MSVSKQREHFEHVSKGIESFSVDFHKNIAEKIDGNFVGSPLGAHTVLSMSAYGAEGRTKDEMRRTLHLPKNDQLAHQEFQTFIDTLNTVEDVTLKVANKIYADKSIKIKETFQEIASTYFRSGSDTIDFSKKVDSANAINQWCVDQTNGKITDIVTAEGLTDNTRVILLNAVYFKANWRNKFNESFTKEKPFHVDKSTTIEVPTMFIQKYFFYKKSKKVDAEIVGLPYENSDFYMLIILPKNINGLQKVEKNLEKIDLDLDCMHKKFTEICLSLPKFKVSTSIDLIPHLIELGMVEMFCDAANFSSMSNESLKVSKVIQKAFIEVNETGTEAAAVTVVEYTKKSLRYSGKEPLVINIDKPFIYRIVHIKTKTTLFSGHIVNPIAP